MLIWLFLVIPIIAAALTCVLKSREIVWWEVAIPVVVCAIVILAGKCAGQKALVTDTEYWGGYLTDATYEEEWDERVSCTHPHYVTKTRLVTDANGRTTTESYLEQEGWEHPYDVEDHPPVWTANDSNGVSYFVSQEEFEYLAKLWKRRDFVEMNRSFHKKDGDAYSTRWDNAYETLQPTVREHNYENRVAVSSSILNYREIPDTEKKRYQLIDYPKTNGRFCPSVLPGGFAGQDDLDKTNALLGRSKQVRVWVLLFREQPLDAAKAQEAFWKGGNKNELVVCVGLAKDSNAVQWAHVFSWTKVETIKIETRNWFAENDKELDLKAFNSWLKPEIERLWVRRPFAEFSYLTVEPPGWAYWMVGIVCLVSSVILCWWIANNDINTDGSQKSRYGRHGY